MAYRDDLEHTRAELRRLEHERDALQRDLALIDTLPSSRTLEARVLGAENRIVRELELELPFDGAHAAALGEALSRSYGVNGRIEQRERAIVWRADLSPRGRSMEVTFEPDGARTKVRIVDRYSAVKQLLALGMVGLPQIGQWILRGDWAWVLGYLCFSAILTVVLGARRNRRTGRRREFEAIGAAKGVERAARSIAFSTPPTRVETEAIETVDAQVARATRATS